jgi:hypothetical protein
MMLASVLSPDDQGITKQLMRVRKFAVAMSLIFLVMAPLQLYTGLRVIGGRTTNEFESLAVLKCGASAIDRSVSEAEFRAALGSIPGAPPLPATTLTEPIPSLKANVLQQINSQINRLETLIEEQHRKQTELFIGFSIRDVFICLLYALAFGAMAKNHSFSTFSNNSVFITVPAERHWHLGIAPMGAGLIPAPCALLGEANTGAVLQRSAS